MEKKRRVILGVDFEDVMNLRRTNVGEGQKLIIHEHGRMNYKDTKPYMSAFLSVDLLTEFAAFCLTDFINWRDTFTHGLYFRPSL